MLLKPLSTATNAARMSLTHRFVSSCLSVVLSASIQHFQKQQNFAEKYAYISCYNGIQRFIDSENYHYNSDSFSQHVL